VKFNSITKYVGEVFYLLGDSKKNIPLLVLMFLSLAFLDLIGIGLIGQYVSLIISQELLLSEYLHDILELFKISLREEELLLWVGVLLIIIFLLKSIASIFINYKIVAFSFFQQARLKSFLMDAYQNMPYELYLKRNSAEYIHSIQTYTSAFGNVLHVGLKTFSDMIVGVSILIMLALVDIQALLLLLSLLSLIVIGYYKTFKNRLRLYGKLSNEASTRMLQGVHEGIEGLKETRILGKEKHFSHMVSNGARDFSHNTVKYIVISSIPRNLLEFILIFFIVLLVFSSVTTEADLQVIVPVISMFGIAGLRLVPVANTLSNTLSQLRFDRYAISKLHEDMVQVSEQSFNNTSQSNMNETMPFNKFEINSVKFSYNNAKKSALNGISLEISAGESIGLIGSSGSGKTTLVDTMLGLLVPKEGGMLYNNKPLNLFLHEWRSKIAYLPQQVFLIDNTLRNNVALGECDEDIDNGILEEALNQAQLTEVVQQLPEGVNTVLGEHGVRLSGGQRQRVALARAFYHKREILIMDEATSALDSETEQEIINEIKRLKGQKTIIVIAHRLTTVQHCDRIYRLENGKVVGVGDPESMLK